MTRADHTAAEIRGNVRDLQISEALAAAERAHADALARNVARIVEVDQEVVKSLATLEQASDTLRSALGVVQVAAVDAREILMAAARDALLLVEKASREAHGRLSAEGMAAHAETCRP